MSISTLLDDLCMYLHLYNTTLPDIKDDHDLAAAEDALIDQADDFITRMCGGTDDMKEHRDSIRLYSSAILRGWRMAMECYILKANATVVKETPPEDKKSAILAWIKNLQEHTNVGQRTGGWYEQGARLLTGSEIYTLFQSPYQRGQLVMAKANPQPRFQNQLVCRSKSMSAFDWGIRFEPVVKQIYENVTKCKVSDLGRIVSKRDPRVAASPDGIVIEGDRLGRIVEMKAPVTRVINNEIPAEYYAQMQTQMEVTDADICDYIEVKFNSPYKIECGPDGPISEQRIQLPSKFFGYIYIMKEDDNDRDPEDMFYEPRLSYYYPESLFGSAMSDIGSYRPDQVVECIPWWCSIYSLKAVHRSAEWWVDMQRRIDSFWVDVELAKKGEFVPPVSSKKPKMGITINAELAGHDDYHMTEQLITEFFRAPRTSS